MKNNKKFKISIIIPSCNDEKLLQKNVPKIKKACSGCEIIVINDKRGRGFSTTVNRGVKKAKGKIVVLLNSDVIPQKGFLEPLINHFSDFKVFAVGCLDKSIENDKIILRGRAVAKWQKGFYFHKKGEVNKTDTAWVSCGSGAFRRSLWLQLGGLDEIFNPFYWEDIDLSFRAKKAGYKILFEPKSIVIHKHKEGSIKRHFISAQIKTISYRNQFLFAWKHMYTVKSWLKHLFWLPYHFLNTARNGDFYFWKGFLWALSRKTSSKLFL